MKTLSISVVVTTINICLAAKLDFNPVQTKESLSPSYDPSSTSLDLDSPSPSFETPYLSKEPLPSYLSKAPLPRRVDSLSPYLPEDYRPRKQNKQVPGTGSLDIYKNFNWTTARASSSLDLELLQTWNNSDWRILDLVLIMDCTGSMSAWIEHSKTTLKSVIDDIVEENENLKVRVAFVGFRDFGDGDIIFSVQDFTFDIPTVKNFISKQRATGGGDLAEDVTGGLYQTLQLSWYPNSVRLASIIADAPTHGKQYHDIGRDDYPEGSPAGVSLENLVEDFKEREIALTLYKLTDKTEKMYDVIKNTYNSEDWVTFVDIREDIDKSVEAGLGYSSDVVQTAYKSKSSNAYKQQYSVQASIKGWD